MVQLSQGRTWYALQSRLCRLWTEKHMGLDIGTLNAVHVKNKGHSDTPPEIDNHRIMRENNVFMILETVYQQ